MIYSGTGHRPDKLLGYSLDAHDRLTTFALSVLKELDPKPTEVTSGMAMGWDLALAQGALSLDIPLHAAIPFIGQESVWSDDWIKLYKAICKAARTTKVVCKGGYAPWKMQARNEYMVNRGDRLLALWDGTAGGTRNCVEYAESIGKPVVNVWEKFKNVANTYRQ